MAGQRPALVIGHPGHELRLHGWCARYRPALAILTTGSRAGLSSARITASRAMAASLEMPVSPLFGAAPDRDIYRFILNGDVAPLLHWCTLLRDWMIGLRPSLLVTDGWQGYNPTHDVTHVLARCAAAAASKALAYDIPILDYAVVPPALAPGYSMGQCERTLSLDATELAAKRAAIDAFPEIEVERHEILPLEGDRLAVESLHQPHDLKRLVRFEAQPAYERYGEERVRDGGYQSVIRKSHVTDLVNSILAAHADAFATAA